MLSPSSHRLYSPQHHLSGGLVQNTFQHRLTEKERFFVIKERTHAIRERFEKSSSPLMESHHRKNGIFFQEGWRERKKESKKLVHECFPAVQTRVVWNITTASRLQT